MTDLQATINRITENRKANMKECLIGSKVNKYGCNRCEDGWIIENGFAKKCGCYYKQQAEIRWQKFGVDPRGIKKISDYCPKNEFQEKARELAKNYVINYDTIKNIKENCIAFLGQSGAGKSHLSLGIGKALIEKGVEVVYMPYVEVMRELKSNSNEQIEYTNIQRKYLNAEMLIIDELFKDKFKNKRLNGELTEADIKHIYPIINQRAINNLPTIFNSELYPEMVVNLDTAIAGRIIERCRDRIIVFKYCNQNNYRLRWLG